MSLKDKLEDFQRATDAVRWLKRPFRPLYMWLFKVLGKSGRKRKAEMNSAFLTNGLAALKHFDKTMTDAGIQYSLAFGTMLGAVREHGFIKHDLDIDTFVWYKDYGVKLEKCLAEAGFVLEHSFYTTDGLLSREDSYLYNGVHIDIFYIVTPENKKEMPYCCDYLSYPDCRSWKQSIRVHGGVMPRKIEIPISVDVVRVPFETLSLPVLANADEFLSFRYGKDYMIPNPGWSNGDNSHIIPMPEHPATILGA